MASGARCYGPTGLSRGISAAASGELLYPGQPHPPLTRPSSVCLDSSPVLHKLQGGSAGNGNGGGGGGDEDDHRSFARLTWSDVWVSLTNAKGEQQVVLHGVSGYAEPGGLLAIMGPSGSGKSTLLDSLAGRLSPLATLKGDVLVNGKKKHLSYGMAVSRSSSSLILSYSTYRTPLQTSRNSFNRLNLWIIDRYPQEVEKMHAGRLASS